MFMITRYHNYFLIYWAMNSEKNSTNYSLYDILGTLVKCSRVCRSSAHSKQQVMTKFGGTLNCPRPNRESTNSE